MRKALLIGVLGLCPYATQAQMVDAICEDTVRLEKQLFGSAGAEVLGYGLRGPDSFIQIWVDPENRDWTLVQTYTNGMSCIMAKGEHWEVPEVTEDPA